MNQPPLKLLHPENSLSQPKLDQLSRLTTKEIIQSLSPGKQGSLKVKPDGTIIDVHHRVRILQARGIDINALPRDIFQNDSLT